MSDDSDKPSETEIEEVYQWAEETLTGDRQAKFPGMTFEDGVIATIQWMRGETPIRPDDD